MKSPPRQDDGGCRGASAEYDLDEAERAFVRNCVFAMVRDRDPSMREPHKVSHHMHHAFAVFDAASVLTGGYERTRSDRADNWRQRDTWV